MQDSSGSRSRRHAPNVCSHESAQVHLSSSSIRPAGTHSRAPQPPNDSVPQLLLALLRALWQATFSQVYALESFVRPLLHLPGVAISLMRATWKCLLRSWVGQIGLALATSVASLRFSYSLTRHVNSNTQEQGRPSGIAAYLGTTLSLLWGCFRLKSQVELKLARPDFAATFQRNLQCQRLQIQAEQRYQIQLEQQQRLASTASPSSGGPVYPQRLVLPDHLIPGDEVTVLCSQELTATILDFLHKQQAGELDWGPAWVESPTTAQSEDGSPRAPNNVTLNRSSRVRRTGDVSITFCSSSALRLSQPSLQGACGRSCFHTSALQNLGMPPPPSALATSRAATVYASSMTSMESVEEESRSAGPGGVEEKGVGEVSGSPGFAREERGGSSATPGPVLGSVNKDHRGGGSADGDDVGAYEARQTDPWNSNGHSPPLTSLKVQRALLGAHRGGPLAPAPALKQVTQLADEAAEQPTGQSQQAPLFGAMQGCEGSKQLGLDQFCQQGVQRPQLGAHHKQQHQHLDEQRQQPRDHQVDDAHYCQQEQQHNHHQQELSLVQQQLRVLEGQQQPPPQQQLQAPQPGGATPVKRSGSRGQRSKMWDELGSSKGTGARRAGSASLDWIGKQRCAHMEGMDAGRSENGRSVRGSLRCSNGSTQMSSKSFSAGEGIVATADNEGSAALRFAQRVAQETGAASSNGAPLPSFLLPPQLPVSTSYDSAHTSAARFAGADTCACTANGESVNGFGSSSGGYSGGGDSTGEADSLFWSSRGVFSGTAQPQDVERDEHALHQTPRMLPSPSSASSSDHEGNQAWHRGGTICHPRHGVEPRSAKGNSALSCADVAGGTGLPSISAAPELSHAGSTNGSHACSSSAAAAAAAAASKGNHPGSGRQIGGATGGTNRSRRSSAPPINLSPVPLPSPACGGSSALDQCLQSGTGGTLRAGAAETAAASAVVRAARRSNSSTPRHSTPNATAEFLPTPPLMPDGAPGLPPTPGPLVPAAHAAVGANAPSTAGGVPSPMIPARSPSQPSTDQPPTARSPAAAPQSEPHSQTSTQSSSLRMGVAVPHLYQQPAISKTVGSAQAPGDCSKGNDGKSLTPALSLPLPPTILHPADPAPGGHAGSIARPAVGGEPAGQPAAPAAGGLSARHTRRADQPQPSHHSVLTAVTGRYLGRGSPPAANLQSTTIATPQSIQVTSPAMSATNSNPPNQLTPASPVPKSSKDAQKSSSSLFSSPWSKKAHASPTAPASASAALGKGVADNHGRRKAGPASPTSPAKLPAPTDLPLSFWGLGKVFEP